MNMERRLWCIAFYIVVLALSVFKDGMETSNLIKIALSASSLIILLILYKTHRDFEALAYERSKKYE